MFDDLRDEKNCQYADVDTVSRMFRRLLEKRYGARTEPEFSAAGLRQAIHASRFGSVFEYLEKRKIISAIPQPPRWGHSIPKTYYVKLVATEELQGKYYTTLYGGGASYTSFSEALSKSIGELLERYVLLTPSFDSRKNKIRRLSAVDARIPQSLLKSIPRFFPWQTKHLRNAITHEVLSSEAWAKAHIHCVQGESLSRKERAWIPLQQVQWGPQIQSGIGADTFVLTPKTTSGAGGGFTPALATLSALCELVERDGFLVYWLNNLSPKRITLTDADENTVSMPFYNIYKRLIDRGFRLYFLDTTTDIRIPSVTCVILAPRDDGTFSVSVTGKCNPNPIKALELSLLEHIAYLNSIVGNYSEKVFEQPAGPFSARGLGKMQRLHMWQTGKLTDKIGFFLQGSELALQHWAKGFSYSGSTPESALAYALAEFERMRDVHGDAYEVFRFSAKHSLLRDLEYSVVKCVVPALVPLYLRENLAPLDSSRLREVPKVLGYVPAADDAYNPVPHPFP